MPFLTSDFGFNDWQSVGIVGARRLKDRLCNKSWMNSAELEPGWPTGIQPKRAGLKKPLPNSPFFMTPDWSLRAIQ
jgi:hypothetical protein